MEHATAETEPKQNGFRVFDKEISLENGEQIKLPGMHIEQMTLYHGSNIAGITSFQEAEETTIGSGVYLTSQKNAAIGYASVRSDGRIDELPLVYEANIADLDIVNLSTRDALNSFSKILGQDLSKKRKEWSSSEDASGFINDMHRWTMVEVADRTLDMIREGNFSAMRDLTFSFGHSTRELLKKEGFDGLMAYEGGENSRGFSIGDHDSFVIFDPTKPKIVKEEIITSRIQR